MRDVALCAASYQSGWPAEHEDRRWPCPAPTSLMNPVSLSKITRCGRWMPSYGLVMNTRIGY